MLLLWILSLAASFLLPATGEVVKSFDTCKQFFLGGKAPELEPENPARICQRYKNKYHFATMYDKDRRIPMFSAYKYQPGKTSRLDEWMIEPQLDLPGTSMEVEANVLGNNQALDQDYRASNIHDRGHLAPPSHQLDPDRQEATFTLTNIVPQLPTLNTGAWREYEESMKKSTKGCLETYVIVGAVPSKLPAEKRVNERVNIPTHIWAAVCCVLKNNQRKSWAVLARNDENKVDHPNLGELQGQLAKLYKKESTESKSIDLFNGACNGPSGSQK